MVDGLAVGKMSSVPAREILHERFQSELAAVRGLLAKAVAVVSRSSPHGKVVRRSLAAKTPRSEEPPSKRRKASPPVPLERAEAAKKIKMTPADREHLATDLAELSAELPSHVVELLQKQSLDCRDGEIEIDIYSMEGTTVIELKKHLDKFVQEKQQPQDVKIVEDEDDEEVDTCGGVSPISIAPSTLQLADASPVVIQNPDVSGSPSSSSNGDSGSEAENNSSDESVSSPAAAEPEKSTAELIAQAKLNIERERKEARSRAREKARQELLEMEKTAMSSDYIHPSVLEQLGIDQYMVSRPPPTKASKKRSSRARVEEALEEDEIRF